MTARSTINIGDGKGTVHIKSESGDAGNSTANGVSVGPGGNLVVNGNVDISSVYSAAALLMAWLLSMADPVKEPRHI